jgi:hypothetical protein
MKRTASGVCVAAAFAFAVTAGAQEPTSTTKQTTSTTKSESKTITVTGCIQQGATASSYTLTNVTPDTSASTPSASTGATGTTGSSATPPSSEMSKHDNVKEWTLVPGASVDLSTHVGHKVTITGTPAAKASAGYSSSTTKSETEPATGATKTEKSETSSKSEMSAGGEHKLNVTSVKMVSASCSM